MGPARPPALPLTAGTVAGPSPQQPPAEGCPVEVPCAARTIVPGTRAGCPGTLRSRESPECPGTSATRSQALRTEHRPPIGRTVRELHAWKMCTRCSPAADRHRCDSGSSRTTPPIAGRRPLSSTDPVAPPTGPEDHAARRRRLPDRLSTLSPVPMTMTSPTRQWITPPSDGVGTTRPTPATTCRAMSSPTVSLTRAPRSQWLIRV